MALRGEKEAVSAQGELVNATARRDFFLGSTPPVSFAFFTMPFANTKYFDSAARFKSLREPPANCARDKQQRQMKHQQLSINKGAIITE